MTAIHTRDWHWTCEDYCSARGEAVSYDEAVLEAGAHLRAEGHSFAAIQVHGVFVANVDAKVAATPIAVLASQARLDGTPIPPVTLADFLDLGLPRAEAKSMLAWVRETPEEAARRAERAYFTTCAD